MKPKDVIIGTFFIIGGLTVFEDVIVSQFEYGSLILWIIGALWFIVIIPYGIELMDKNLIDSIIKSYRYKIQVKIIAESPKKRNNGGGST